MTRAGKLDRPVAAVAAGRYVLGDVLGVGGMATVYRAHDARLDLPRAVKLLNPELVVSPGVRKRFEMEARTMAKLHHTNIVSVYDIGVEDELAFMVMELVEGGSLNDRIKNVGYLLPRTALSSVQSILNALVMAHGKGVIHRDIKPHNVLVTLDGTPKLTDFGIAHVIGQDKALTASNAVIGTWAFMAPEQRKSSRRVTAQSDIYAVGATLYALVTARDPFDIYNKELQREMFAGIPEALVEVIERATRYWPEERYASAADMLAEVQRVDGLLRPEYLEEPTRPVPVVNPPPGAWSEHRASLVPEAPPPREITFDSSSLDDDVPAPTPTLYPALDGQAELRTDPLGVRIGDSKLGPTDPRADALEGDDEATPMDVWREKADPTERLRRAVQRAPDAAGGLSDPVAPPRVAGEGPVGAAFSGEAGSVPGPVASPVSAVRPAPIQPLISRPLLALALSFLVLVALGVWVLVGMLPKDTAVTPPPVSKPPEVSTPAQTPPVADPSPAPSPPEQSATPPVSTPKTPPPKDPRAERIRALPGQ